MPLGTLLVNVVPVSSCIGALIALAMLYAYLRSRGVLLLAVTVRLAVAGLGASAVIAAGLATRAWSTLAALSAVPGYAARAASFGLLLAGRAAVRPDCGSPRSASWPGWRRNCGLTRCRPRGRLGPDGTVSCRGARTGATAGRATLRCGPMWDTLAPPP